MYPYRRLAAYTDIFAIGIDDVYDVCFVMSVQTYDNGCVLAVCMAVCYEEKGVITTKCILIQEYLEKWK